MIVNNVCYCDECGSKLDYESEFRIKLEYNTVDACFQGSGIRRLQIERKLGEDNDFSEALQQEYYHYCDDCQSDKETIMKKFEINARRRRTIILLSIRDGKRD